MCLTNNSVSVYLNITAYKIVHSLQLQLHSTVPNSHINVRLEVSHNQNTNRLVLYLNCTNRLVLYLNCTNRLVLYLNCTNRLVKCLSVNHTVYLPYSRLFTRGATFADVFNFEPVIFTDVLFATLQLMNNI